MKVLRYLKNYFRSSRRFRILILKLPQPENIETCSAYHEFLMPTAKNDIFQEPIYRGVNPRYIFSGSMDIRREIPKKHTFSGLFGRQNIQWPLRPPTVRFWPPIDTPIPPLGMRKVWLRVGWIISSWWWDWSLLVIWKNQNQPHFCQLVTSLVLGIY